MVFLKNKKEKFLDNYREKTTYGSESGKTPFFSSKRKKNLVFIFMALPGVIYFILFCYLPMFGILLAFKDFKYHRGGFLVSFFKSKWVWFDNFKYLFSSNDAWVITRNTVCYNILFIILGTVLSIAIAIAINEMLHKKLTKFFQTCIIFPHFLTYVIISYFVFSFLSVDKGIINSLLISIGKITKDSPIQWYNDPKYWPYILTIVEMWKSVGFGSVIYLASIAGIDKTFYEAARIDGATKWQEIRYITLPHLKPLVILLTTLSMSRIFSGNLDLFWNVPKESGALFNVTNIFETYILRALQGSADLGMTTAAGLYQSIVALILLFVFNKILKKTSPDNAIF